MVWNSTQSALYKAVDDFNSSANQCENICENYTEKIPQKFIENNPEKCAQKSRENCTEKCTDFEGKKCEKNARNFCENDCKNCPKNDVVSRLFSDRDFLLVAGLILILMNEKADFKLILALAIVLLG